MTPRVSWVCPPLQGFYPGGTAIAFRQMTNWASRQGFTEAVRDQFKLRLHGSKSAKLSKAEEVGSGILGGDTHALLPFLAAVNMSLELSFNLHTGWVLSGHLAVVYNTFGSLNTINHSETDV